jgi:DNA-binding response OmpR family regulator
MWEKIVLNLLSNAFKFTFEGGIEVRLTATGSRRRAAGQRHRRGHTGGRAAAPLRALHRVEGQRSRSHEGSGIRLALVHDLVELHGGAIRVRSEVGRGTEFVVAVPSGTAHLPARHVGGARRVPDPAPVRADAYVEEALRWLPGASAPPESEPAATGVRERVLLVDDNADMRDHVRRLLGRRYEVEAVADGTAALASLRARLPDLVLSDVMMPGLDGVGLLRAIRADPGLRELPVILLSARAGDEAKAEGLDAGADDYLAKPFSARELLARVGANVAMARVRREAAGALQESEARFRTMADNAPALIYVVDAQGQVTFANRHYEALFGRPADDVLGDGWRRIVHPEDVEPFHAAFLAAFAQRRPFRAEVGSWTPPAHSAGCAARPFPASNPGASSRATSAATWT